jgi:serine/threonine protein kinase
MNLPEIPGLQCIALLNRGSSLITWKAIQESLQREVDVRIVEPDMLPEQREQILKISRLVARLAHPNLAQVIDIVSNASITYVLTEHVEGATLAEMVAGTGPLKASQALRIAEQLAEALQYAWAEAQLVVRNLKPQNIRVNAQGVLKLSEFTLAVQIVEGRNPVASDGGHIVGTPHFIAPEQARGDSAIDTRADMYAFGAVLYFLVTGVSPFEGRDHYDILQQQLTGQIPHPRTINDQLPTGLCHLLCRLMMKAPGERPATWTAVLNDIHRLQKNQDIVNPPASHAGSTIAPFAGASRMRRRPVAVSGASASTPAARPASPPRSRLRPVLWFLLLIWFVVLGNSRLDNPLGLPPSLLIALPLPGLSTALEELKPQPETVPPPSAPEPTATPAESPSPAAHPSTPGLADPAAPDHSPSATPSGDATGLAAEPLRTLADLLRNEDIAGAIAYSEKLVRSATDSRYREMHAALQRLPSSNPLVEHALRGLIGKEIVIRYMGNERRIIPTAIQQGEIEAAFIAADGSSRPVVLSIDKIDPAERLRLLPPAQTAEDHVIHCILALQAGNASHLAAHQGAAGALAPVFAPQAAGQ